jgi:hypothetical protein
MREILISIRHNGCPVSDTSAAHPDVHIQNLSKGQLANGVAKRLLSVRGSADAITAFATDFRSHSAVQRFERVGGEDETSLAYYTSEIEFDPENPSILSLVHNHGCFQHNTVSVKHGMEHWKVYTEDGATVHELIDKLEALGNDVTLYRSMDMDSLGESDSFDVATVLAELTARQQAVLETALSMGYYDTSAAVTTEDVAEEFDLHQSTVWEHLKKAENKILQTVGHQLVSDKTHDLSPDTETVRG